MKQQFFFFGISFRHEIFGFDLDRVIPDPDTKKLAPSFAASDFKSENCFGVGVGVGALFGFNSCALNLL